MKRFLCLILCLLMLFSLAACNDTKGDDGENTTAPDATTPPEEEAVPFYAGYGIADITPTTFPIMFGMRTEGRKVLNNIYATCVAVSDQETTALFLTLDVQEISDAFYTQVLTEVVKATKVPKTNVFICATHNHSSPKIPDEGMDMNLIKWKKTTATAAANAAKEAVDDLSLAEGYIATANTKGLAFVRRYLLADGTYRGIHSANPSTAKEVAHETEADPELQILRFVREDGKKDIVMANWQAHAAHAYAEDTRVISGDFIYWFRKELEAKDDVLFAYYQGGAGNINLSSSIENVSGRYTEVGKKLAVLASDALVDMEKITLGKIKVTTSSVKAPIKDCTDQEKADAALKIVSGGSPDLVQKYGFINNMEAGYYYTCYEMWKKHPDGKKTIQTSAIAFGDVAFVSAPYEMFDTNAMEVKDASPYKMTFVCAYSNGNNGYIPSALAYSHGEYEVYTSMYDAGTGELFSNEMIKMLKELKNS